MGIEALSRGAASAVFVENDRAALDALRENLVTLGFEDRSTVVPGDAATFVAAGPEADLIVLDPPYEFDGWAELLTTLHDAVVVIESDREIELPQGWQTHRVRRYGGTVVTLAFAPAVPESIQS